MLTERTPVDRQQKFLRLLRWVACGASAQAKEILYFIRIGDRDFQSADLARGFQMTKIVKMAKHTYIAILKCMQRFVIAS